MKKINDGWKGYKKYFTYDSGEKSFLIYIKQNNVSTSELSDKFIVYIYKKNLDNIYNILVSHFIALKIFIGKTPIIKMSKYSTSSGKNFDGNTILLLLNDNNYVFISDNNIQKFTTDNDKILKFYSFIINDSPHPLAIGKKHFYFFLYPDGYLPKIELLKNKNDLEKIMNKGFELNPYLISLTTHKNKYNISLNQLKEFQKKTLDNISIGELKQLAIMYSVTPSGKKKEIVDKIENLRGIIVYKK
jgi:hypothetical protein